MRKQHIANIKFIYNKEIHGNYDWNVMQSSTLLQECLVGMFLKNPTKKSRLTSKFVAVCGTNTASTFLNKKNE